MVGDAGCYSWAVGVDVPHLLRWVTGMRVRGTGDGDGGGGIGANGGIIGGFGNIAKGVMAAMATRAITTVIFQRRGVPKRRDWLGRMRILYVYVAR